MKILLIDAGNTTVDFRSYDFKTQNLKSLCRLETSSLKTWDSQQLKKDLQFATNNYLEIYFSSVVPAFDTWIYNFAKDQKVAITDIKNSPKIKQKDFSGLTTTTIGTDLIANFYANAWDDALIVNLGTASTILEIKNHTFLGVIIAPGIQKSLDSLIDAAALLEEMDFAWTDEKIGRTTQVAISLGAINGHYQMLKSFLETKKTPTTKILFTGGNAQLIFEGLQQDNYTYQEDLIFQGILNLI